jgi:hypothetical protein
MGRNDTARLTRSAAIRLMLSLAIVLGGSCLMLQSTVWKKGSPEPPEPFYTELPGVDLSGLPANRKASVLKQLNRQRCRCDCMRTVAGCRNNHGCSLSLDAAQRAVDAARKR